MLLQQENNHNKYYKEIHNIRSDKKEHTDINTQVPTHQCKNGNAKEKHQNNLRN